MKRNSNPYYLLINVIFYFFLTILIGFLILPHTSVAFRKKVSLPFSLHLNSDDIILVKGETHKLYVIGLNKRVNYYSSDFKVCDVNLNGKLHANRIGTAIIKARVNKKILKCRVKVIDINKKVVMLKKGDTSKVKVLGYSKRVRWKCSNRSIASINRRGKITAKKTGKATITGSLKGKKVSCKLIVK